MQVHDDKLPRNKWNIAVIERLIAGNNLTRAAVIGTANGLTSRPIVKLYPLEVQEAHRLGDEEHDDELPCFLSGI